MSEFQNEVAERVEAAEGRANEAPQRAQVTVNPGEMLIEVDLVFNQDESPRAIANEAEQYGCRAAMISESGPGGGWPVFEIAGTRHNLQKLLEHWEFDDTDEIEIYQVDREPKA